MSDRTRDRLRKAVEGHQETLAEAKSIMTDLILTELTVFLQFANFARDSFLTKSYSAGRRQQDMATRAHDAVLHFLPKSAPTNDQRTLIEKQLGDLKTVISDLENLSKETAD
jgi:regulator of sirC expression with transglutaminase-like and TPR domain